MREARAVIGTFGAIAAFGCLAGCGTSSTGLLTGKAYFVGQLPASLRGEQVWFRKDRPRSPDSL